MTSEELLPLIRKARESGDYMNPEIIAEIAVQPAGIQFTAAASFRSKLYADFDADQWWAEINIVRENAGLPTVIVVRPKPPERSPVIAMRESGKAFDPRNQDTWPIRDFYHDICIGCEGKSQFPAKHCGGGLYLRIPLMADHVVEAHHCGCKRCKERL